MLYQIFSFLLDIVAGLISGACLLRLYMQAQRVPFGNPVGQFVFALSDWIVLPLRKILPAGRRWELACLVAAFLPQLAEVLALWLLAGPVAGAGLALPWLALCGLVKVTLSGLIGMLLIYAVLSWVQPFSPVYGVLQRLAEPLLRPVRKLLPLVGGVDLSALVALVLLQVALMVLSYVQARGLVLLAGGI